MSFYTYGNGGLMEDVILRKVDSSNILFKTFDEMFSYFLKEYKDNNLTIKFLWFDGRLNRNVFCFLADHSGFEQQFVKYFVEEK